MREQLLVNNLKLAATLTAPGLARCFVEHELRAWAIPADVVADAKLIVSELVTNAVQFTGFAHPNPTYADLEHVALLAVQIRVRGRSLFVEVWDNGRESKNPPPIRDDDECGRGLSIVSNLVVNMGHSSQEDGELVWAELDAGPDIAAVPQASPVIWHSRYPNGIATFTEPSCADRALIGRLTAVGG